MLTVEAVDRTASHILIALVAVRCRLRPRAVAGERRVRSHRDRGDGERRLGVEQPPRPYAKLLEGRATTKGGVGREPSVHEPGQNS